MEVCHAIDHVILRMFDSVTLCETSVFGKVLFDKKERKKREKKVKNKRVIRVSSKSYKPTNSFLKI